MKRYGKAMNILKASSVGLLLFGLAAHAQLSDSLDERIIVDTVSLDMNQSFSIIADTTNDTFQLQIIQVPLSSDEGASIEEMGDLSYAVYVAITRLGKRIEKRIYKIREMYSPRLEKVEVGDLTFNATFSYGYDIKRHKLRAAVTFDGISLKGR